MKKQNQEVSQKIEQYNGRIKELMESERLWFTTRTGNVNDMSELKSENIQLKLALPYLEEIIELQNKQNELLAADL